MNSRKIGGSKGKGKNHRSRGKGKTHGSKGKRKTKTKNTIFTQAQNLSSSSNSSDTESKVELLVLMHGDIPIKIIQTDNCNPTNYCFGFALQNNATILSIAQAGCRNRNPGHFFHFIKSRFLRSYDGNEIFEKYIETMQTEIHLEVGTTKISKTAFNRANLDIEYTTKNTQIISGERGLFTINKRYSKSENEIHFGIYFASDITVLTKKGEKTFKKGDDLLQCDDFIDYTNDLLSLPYNEELFSEHEIQAGGNTTKEAVINFFECDIVNVIDESCSVLSSVDEQDLSVLESKCEKFSDDFYEAMSNYP